MLAMLFLNLGGGYMVCTLTLYAIKILHNKKMSHSKGTKEVTDVKCLK